MSGIDSVTVDLSGYVLLGTRSSLFMAGAVVARPQMRCQGHVAPGTSRLHHSVRSLRDLHSLRPAALGV